MNHPNDALLLRALHEPDGVSPELRDHLSGCAVCRARQVELSSDDAFVAGLLRVLDHPLPALSVDTVIAAEPRSLRRRALLVAEVTLFFAAAAAAMTIPASPLHRLLFPKVPVVISPVIVLPGEASPTQDEGVAPVGIALAAPAALVVEFKQMQSTGILEVQLTEGSDVTVRSRGGTVGFTVNEGRVRVDNRVPAGEYLVEIPTSLRSARIVVGARLLFSKDGDHTVPSAPTAGGRFRIALADSARTQQ